MIGNQLESAGWRQGSIIKTSDIQTVLNGTGIEYEAGMVLIVASQSCDIANNNLELDPYVEITLCREIVAKKGNFEFSKNPRCLHTNITQRTGDRDVFVEISLELKAFERFAIDKSILATIQPDVDRIFEKRPLSDYIYWLCSRYSRPALPTTFNTLIDKADPNGKLREAAKKANEQLSGIYVEINPDAEIQEKEHYSVNLMGLLPADYEGDTQKADKAIEKYAEILRTAGMEVVVAIRNETEVSLATIKRFKRFYLDDLSLKVVAPLPPETKH